MNPPEKLHSPEDLPPVVLEIHDTLKNSGIKYAFGGAIATKFYTPRAPTQDVDINIFIPIEQRYDADVEKVLKTFNPKMHPFEEEVHQDRIYGHDQTRLLYDDTVVDLFFSFSEFHDAAAERINYVDYRGERLPILAPEDIIIFKIMFSLHQPRRERDWADIGGILDHQVVDPEYIFGWLRQSEVYQHHKRWINARLAEHGINDPYEDTEPNA